MKDKIIKNIFSNWANLLVNIGISFFLAPFIVHQLGNAYYGIWVIMMQFTGYLYLLDFGVRESIIRYVSKHEATGDAGELNEVLNAGILLYSAIGLVCLIITGTLAWLFPMVFNVDTADVTVARIVVILSGITIAQMLVFNVFSGILMGLQRYDIFNKIGILFAFLRLALILVFLNMGYNLIALALIQLAVGLGNNLVIYLYSRKLLKQHNIPFRYTSSSWQQRKPVLKQLYNYSIHVLINNLGQKAIFYTDALVIGIFLSASAVTFYAIAGNLIEYLRRLIILANMVLNPVASELESRQQTKSINDLLIQGSRFSFLLALPICITYLTMGREFIGLWMGDEYSSLSGDVLLILTVTVLLAIPHNTISSILYGISKHKLIARLRIVEALCNLGLSMVLVNYMGIAGVALGTAIPQFFLMTIMLPVLAGREMRLSMTQYWSQVYISPLLASLPFVGITLFASTELPTQSLLIFFIQLTLMLPIYIISVSIVCFSSEERATYWAMVRRLVSPKST